MLEGFNKKDQKHLINLIGQRCENTPSFALLIGAGASKNSGVKLANEMIEEWRRQIYIESQSSEKYEEWVSKQIWYNADEEYSILFEKVCDQPSQRRIYIEKCVIDAKPSWGYIYLSNILANNYYNVIFTPNFDDLLNEACFLYSDVKPLVCAHDSGVSDIRIKTIRPKIIKLHGDYLYDSLKNTRAETKILEENMRDKFKQFLREYGLIILGYGGNDRSIMDLLNNLVGSNDFIPHGLYYCRRKEDKISKKVAKLLRHKRSYWVEIEGFDEFMAELHHGLNLQLPDSVHNPYKALREKLNIYILPSKEIKHPLIRKDIEELEKQIKQFEKTVTGKKENTEYDSMVPYKFLGDSEYTKNNYDKAIIYYKKAEKQNPDDNNILYAMFWSYMRLGEDRSAQRISVRYINKYPKQYIGYYSRGIVASRMGFNEKAIIYFNLALKYSQDHKENIKRDKNRNNYQDSR